MIKKDNFPRIIVREQIPNQYLDDRGIHIIPENGAEKYLYRQFIGLHPVREEGISEYIDINHYLLYSIIFGQEGISLGTPIFSYPNYPIQMLEGFKEKEAISALEKRVREKIGIMVAELESQVNKFEIVNETVNPCEVKVFE